MDKTMLIADDLTGALDAGVCLLPRKTRVCVSASAVCEASIEASEVLCVNAATRHLEPAEAATCVRSLVLFAQSKGVSKIVKKTDSALRGNIGAELEAAWRASEEPRLHFIPAFPELNRVTVDGIHYIDGVPVSESVFGLDPFEPVASSSVAEIIGATSEAPVFVVSADETWPRDFEGIVVYDAQTDSDIDARLSEFASAGEKGVIAGCAGVASALARVAHSETEGCKPAYEGNLLVVCGSVNGVSRRQCAVAKGSGASTFHIAETEKCSDTWLASTDGRDFVAKVNASWDVNPLTVIDGSGLEDLSGLVPDDADVRQVVSDHIGALLAAVCASGVRGRVLVTGGDVLASFLAQAGASVLVPIGQVAPGVVAFGVHLDAGDLRIASKSGGFGTETLFVDLAKKGSEKRSVDMLNKYSLRLPKVVYGGESPTDEMAAALKKEGAKKVVVFTDKMLRKLGLVEPTLDAVRAAGAEATIIDDIPAEPTYSEVQNVVDQVKGLNADAIIAVGGGSVMDSAKLAGVCATDEYTVHDLLSDPSQASKKIKMFAVPTTAGTGAEATPNAIVAVPEEELKVGIVNDGLIADYVVLDARMIKNLPRSIAAATGVDALCHAIECFTGNKANPFSDIFALEAFDLIVNNIEAACDDPEAMDAKRAMQIASFYAGIAITASGTTAVHALSYPLGGKYHIAHGVSNAILLCPVMHFNEPAIRERLAAAYDRAIHAGATTVEEKSAAVIERMDEIVAHLNIPKKLDELGVHDVDIDQLSEAGMKVQRLLSNNMREVTYEDAKAIYAQIL